MTQTTTASGVKLNGFHPANGAREFHNGFMEEPPDFGPLPFETLNGAIIEPAYMKASVYSPVIHQVKEQVKEPVQDEGEEEHAPIFSPMGLGELLAMPPKPWLVDEVLGAGDLVMVYGPPGSGKTFVVIDFIFSACLGIKWARRFAVNRPLTVAYAAGEGISGLPARFKAAAEFYGVSELPNFSFFRQVPQLHHRAGVQFDTAENIERFVQDWQRQPKPLDLLIVDTLHSATVGAEENSASDMGRVLATLKYAQRELGCAVMLVHHTNKSGTAERGSSALRGAMDAMIGLKEVGAKWAIYCEKLKDGAAWQPQTFDLTAKADSVRVWWNDPISETGDGSKQDQDRERIVQLLTETGEALTDTEIEKMLGIGRSQVNKLLTQLMDDDEITRDKRDPNKPKSNWNPFVYMLNSSVH